MSYILIYWIRLVIKRYSRGNGNANLSLPLYFILSLRAIKKNLVHIISLTQQCDYTLWIDKKMINGCDNKKDLTKGKESRLQ